MITEDELNDLYASECNLPYTDEELAFHSNNRSLKGELEIEHAYNYKAIKLTQQWIDFVDNGGEEPEDHVWQIVRPSRRVLNDRCVRLETIIGYYLQCEYRNCPKLPIFVYCSRSTATFFSKLMELYETEHLISAYDAVAEITSLASNLDEQKLTTDQFHQRLKELLATFKDNTLAYSQELRTYLRQFMKKRNGETQPPASKADVEGIVGDSTRQMTAAVTEDGKKTRAKFDSASRRIVKDITTKKKSDYEKGGPINRARASQVEKVVLRMSEFREKPFLLPFSLAGKAAIKWISQACTDVWEYIEGGYPNTKALYLYCKKNADVILSRAGI